MRFTKKNYVIDKVTLDAIGHQNRLIFRVSSSTYTVGHFLLYAPHWVQYTPPIIMFSILFTIFRDFSIQLYWQIFPVWSNYHLIEKSEMRSSRSVVVAFDRFPVNLNRVIISSSVYQLPLWECSLLKCTWSVPPTYTLKHTTIMKTILY